MCSWIAPSFVQTVCNNGLGNRSLSSSVQRAGGVRFSFALRHFRRPNCNFVRRFCLFVVWKKKTEKYICWIDAKDSRTYIYMTPAA